jgi:hypothetical protein
MSLAIAITAKYMYACFSTNTAKRLVMMMFELLIAHFDYSLKGLMFSINSGQEFYPIVIFV